MSEAILGHTNIEFSYKFGEIIYILLSQLYLTYKWSDKFHGQGILLNYQNMIQDYPVHGFNHPF